MSNKIKNGLFILLMIILLLPAAQQKISFAKNRKLDGYFTIAPQVYISAANWWDGTYQSGKAKYLNDHFGFRPEVLITNSQVDYSLFDKYHSMWIAPGIDHYLFQTLHIDAFTGKDFKGDAPILERLQKYKAVHDTLARLGIIMTIVHAPNKAFIYREYLPRYVASIPKGPTNFDTYMRLGDSLGITQIDCNNWFLSLKGKNPDQLFTKQGIHWSLYGSLVAADSLVKYMEHARAISIPHPVWTKVVRTQTPRYPDDDLAKTLNLIFPITTETFTYPDVSYAADATTVKPRVIYIGDSFLDIWRDEGFMSHTNSDWQIWNHFKVIEDKDYVQGKPDRLVADIDWIKNLENAQFVFIMYTAFNLPDLGDGFIEKAYDHYFPTQH